MRVAGAMVLETGEELRGVCEAAPVPTVVGSELSTVHGYEADRLVEGDPR